MRCGQFEALDTGVSLGLSTPEERAVLGGRSPASW